MIDSDRTVCVIFNGEIYNFRELRAELSALGHIFRTQSDTEVIVHGFKEWGDNVLDRLNGMFGLAIWDSVRHRLMLARDAAGVKMVYYRVADGAVMFGSEIRAILAALPNPPSVNITALNLFLRYRYTPSPLTIYDGIRKLPAGSKAIFENGTWKEERWYQSVPRPWQGPPTDGEATEELLAIYKRAMKRHLISDVPVGLLLSGGVDSGLLLGLMGLYGADWPTFTVGYGRSLYRNDEMAEAAATARMLNAENVSVMLSRETFEAALPKIVSAVEEPIASSSIVPMYFLCERARKDVKVALIGQGPDELFGGYTRHLGVQYGKYWRAVPKSVRSVLSAGIDRLPRAEALKRGVLSLGIEGQLPRFQNVFSIAAADVVDGLFRDGVLPQKAGDAVLGYWRDFEPEMRECDELGAFQVLELRSSLPDELLMYSDKLSMAHGLEVRVPYLDKEVVEYVQRLPAMFKVRMGQRKWLHRQVCKRFLPESILRRKKRGFAVDVVDDWFRSSLQRRTGEYLVDPNSRIFTLLQPAVVRRLLDEHLVGRHDNHKILFSLVVLEEWLRANTSAAHFALDH